MANLGNQKIKDTYQLVLQTDPSGNLQNLSGGTPNPFIVNGNLRYVDGNQADGYVLKSDASGNASWGAGAGTSYWSANTNGSISPSGTSTNIRISGDTIIKGDLSLTSNNASLTLPYYGTLKAKNSAGTTRTVLYNIGDTGVVFGDTNTVTTKLQGTNVELEGEVTVKDDINISGSTFNKGNLGVSGRTYLGTIDAAGGSYSADKILVAQSNGEVEYLTTAELKADIGDNDYWTGNTDGTSISPSGTSTPIKVLGNISGSSDLYLGDSTDPNPSIIAPTTLTLRGEGSGNDYLILQQDNVDIFIDGSTYVNVDPDSIILNSSSKAVNTAIMADNATQLFYGDATNNVVRLKEHVFITPTGETSVDYSRALFVSGGSLFHSGGTNNPNEAIVSVGNISGTTDGLFGRNLGVSGRTYLGTIDAAGDSYSADKILVAQGGGEIEYLTTAQLKADIGDADYWTATTDGTSISPSGSNTTTTVKISGDTFIKGDLGVTGLTNSNELSAQTLTAKTNVNIGSEVSYLSIHNQYIKWKTSNRIFISSSPTSSAPNRLYDDWRLNDSDYLYFGTGNDLSIYHNGTNSIIDNNTGTLQILASAITIGDTTSEVTINDNLVVDEDLPVNGTTLYVDSSNTKVGVGTTSPTHELTVSGGGAWIAWTEPTQISFVNGSSFFGYTPTDATVPTPLTIGGTTVRALVDGAYYYGTTTSPFFLNGRGYWGVTWAGSNVTLTDAEAANCIAYGGVIPGNDKYFSVAAGDVIFQVSGSSIMSGSTDLVDIFASSAITNQDVYWTATTDGTSISPSGSNVTTTVRMSGDTHIKGNLGVSGNTYTTGAFVVGNATLNTSQLDISSGDFTLDVEGDITLDANGADIILSDDGTDFGRFKRDSSDFIIKSEGNNNDIVFRGQDAGVTRDALLLDMSDAGTATFNNGVNISGATSGRTDASFGGNLGISGKTFLDDHLRFSSAKQVEWVDSSTYIQGTTTQLALDGDLNITLLADNQIKMTSTEMTNVGRVGISGDTNINGALSGLTDARFSGNLGVSGNTYLPNFQNGTTVIQCSFSLKTFSTNNWASHPSSQGGLNSEFWTQDTGVDTLPALYQYYNTQSPSAGNPSPSQGAFCAPATGKLRKIVFNGANSTGALKGDDLEIEIARAPVTDGQSGLSYTQLTGITHTLPDNTAKRFIIDCNFGGSGVDVAANDVFLVAFKTTESSNAFIRINLSAYFEYPLPLIT